MAAVRSAEAVRRFRMAVFLSLVVHAAVVAPLLVVAGHTSSRFKQESPWLDTRVCDVEAVITLLAPEPPDRKFGPAPTMLASPPLRVVSTDPPVGSKPNGPSVGAQPSAKPTADQSVSSAPSNAGNTSGTQPRAGGETARFFHVPAFGKSVVYVIDRSSSMGRNGALTAAKQELLDSLSALPEGVRFQVLAYNRTAEPLRVNGRCDLLPAGPESKRTASDHIERLRAEGSSGHSTALRRALALQADVIFFLTDAGDLKADEIGAITRTNHGRTSIHVIELLHEGGKVQSKSALADLAGANRGTYRAVELRGQGSWRVSTTDLETNQSESWDRR